MITRMSDVIKQKIEDLQKLLVLNRINILEILYKEDTCVCTMVERLNLKHNLISHHLKTLVDLGYIDNTRNGQHIIYSLLASKRKTINELLDLVNS